MTVRRKFGPTGYKPVQSFAIPMQERAVGGDVFLPLELLVISASVLQPAWNFIPPNFFIGVSGQNGNQTGPNIVLTNDGFTASCSSGVERAFAGTTAVDVNSFWSYTAFRIDVGDSSTQSVGVDNSSLTDFLGKLGLSAYNYGYWATGEIYSQGVLLATVETFTTGDVISVGVRSAPFGIDSADITFFKNGQAVYSINLSGAEANDARDFGYGAVSIGSGSITCITSLDDLPNPPPGTAETAYPGYANYFFFEPDIVDATVTGGGVISASQDETLAATDTVSATETLLAAQAETGAAADTVSSTKTLLAAQAETGAAVDTVSATETLVAAVSETGAAVDAPAATKATLAAISETGAAIDTQSSSAPITGAISETGAAADTVSSSRTTISAISETGAAVDTVTAQLITNGSVAEAIAAVDSCAATMVRVALVDEVGAVVDMLSVSTVTFAAMIEQLVASEILTAQQIFVMSVAESVTLIDAVATLNAPVGSKLFVAVLPALDLSSRLPVRDLTCELSETDFVATWKYYGQL